MAAMATASFPLINNFSILILFENGDCYVGTDLGAQAATGTPLLFNGERHGVAEAVGGVAQHDQRTGTGDGAESAPFAAGLDNFYLRHLFFPGFISGRSILNLEQISRELT